MQDQDIDGRKDGIDPSWAFSIIRDIAVLVAFSWSSVFIVGFVFKIFKKVLHRQPHTDFFLGYFALLFVLMIVGFTASACLSRKSRWLHLICVAVGVWAVDAFGYFTIHGLDTSFGWYLAIRLLVIVMPMLAGGALSYMFKKGSHEPVA